MQNKKGEELEEIGRALEKYEKKDHIVNFIKAMVSAIPSVGGALSSLMSDYIPKTKEQRLVDFTNGLAKDLERLRGSIKEDFITTDDFAYIFEQCYKGVAENYQKEKLEGFRGILLNSLIETDIKSEEKEFFLTILNDLSTIHIRALKFLNTPQAFVDGLGLEHNQYSGASFSQMFQLCFPGYDLDHLRKVVQDLYLMRFTNTDSSIFGTMTAGTGVNIVQGRITEFGSKFIRFCTAP